MGTCGSSAGIGLQAGVDGVADGTGKACKRDLEAWSTTNPKVLSKIIRLIAETTRSPRTGTGKPERLKHLGGEVWSRRITEKDRLVYDIQPDVITIIACRFHYDGH